MRPPFEPAARRTARKQLPRVRSQGSTRATVPLHSSGEPLDRAPERAQQRADRGSKDDQPGNGDDGDEGDDQSVFDEALGLGSISHAASIGIDFSACRQRGRIFTNRYHLGPLIRRARRRPPTISPNADVVIPLSRAEWTTTELGDHRKIHGASSQTMRSASAYSSNRLQDGFPRESASRR